MTLGGLTGGLLMGVVFKTGLLRSTILMGMTGLYTDYIYTVASKN